jgi:TorA maturation chaperone TorD
MERDMTQGINTLKAEFWLCLARAFLPPDTESSRRALREHLADDLMELASALGYPVIQEIDALRNAIASLPGDADMLALYSKLFLIPGIEHPHINAAAYLDGTTHGGSLRQLVECYRACGLEKDESFADLPDHVAVQLEFVAWLFAVAAARHQGEAAPDAPMGAPAFLAAFVSRWAQAFRCDLELAHSRFALSDNPWLHLARMLETASRIEAAPDLAGENVAVAGADMPTAEDDIALLRSQYAGRSPDAADLARIRASLAADGLASDHIAVPPQARDAAAGLTPLNPPAPPRHSLSGK